MKRSEGKGKEEQNHHRQSVGKYITRVWKRKKVEYIVDMLLFQIDRVNEIELYF